MIENQSIICFASDPWDSMWRNRHQIMSRLSRTNKVLYIEPKTYTVPELLKKSSIKRSLQNKRLKHVMNGLWVFRHPFWGVSSRWPVIKQLGLRLRIHAIHRATRKLQMQHPILWVVDPRLGTVVKYFKKALVCYHVVDNYSAAPYYSEKIREDLKQAEKFILPIADLVIVTSPFLQKEKSKFNSNVHLVKNAVDYEQFSIFQSFDNMPKDMEGIPKPIIGYIGAINEKLDFELLAYIAHKRPQWSFVFIGDYVNNPKSSESYKFIQQHPSNVFLLGKRDVKEVPRYIHACDVCIMPYCRNDYTKAIDSLKLYEYFACGKPVVATDISVTRGYSQVVYIAKDGDDFIQKLEEVLVLFPSVRREIQRSIALQNTWDKRVEQLSLLIQTALHKLQVQK